MRFCERSGIARCVGSSWEQTLGSGSRVVLADVVADRQLSGVCEDLDNDKYLAAAFEGRASHVVAGDRRFLALG